MISIAFPNLFQQAVLPFQFANPHKTGTSESSGAVSGRPGRSSVFDSKCAPAAGVVDGAICKERVVREAATRDSTGRYLMRWAFQLL